MAKARKSGCLPGAVLVAMVAAPLHAAPDARAVPYWASLKSGEVYMRVGPGEDYRISWVYHRQHLPLKVLRVMQNWRLAEDPEGARGWVLVNMLTRGHDGYVTGSTPADMREAPDTNARLLWRLAPGVLGKLGECASGWCRFTVSDRAGYVRQDALWGSATLAN
ncbi:MAG: hypothetical protein KGK11_01995 [Sphingomonadales bacterium]|nr:hypothetical protein [Sphingomonadales bacterium]